MGKPCQDRLTLVGGRGGLLVDLQAAVLQQDEVGECTAYIDSNQGRGHCGVPENGSQSYGASELSR